jgi:hypothetical protein
VHKSAAAQFLGVKRIQSLQSCEKPGFVPGFSSLLNGWLWPQADNELVL